MTTPPEADLEAHLSAQLPKIFPHIPPGDIDHQTHLVLRFGRNEITVNGETKWKKEGRADIVLNHKGKPIAVIELKRAGVKLTRDDVDQGRNYARVLEHPAPLVVVTNGSDTWLIDAYSGEDLAGDSVEADQLRELFANASKIAAEKRQAAIEALLGTDSSVWESAVQMATDRVIDRLSTWDDDLRKPFGRFHFVRQAAQAAIDAFESGKKVVVLEGAPLTGKTNALKSFSVLTDVLEPKFAMLFVMASMAHSRLFERLADVLTSELGWEIEGKDARTWLRRFASKAEGPTLVVAVDGVAKGSLVAKELETFAESGFGDRLKFLVTTESADDVLMSGRDVSALAEAAVSFRMSPLTADEFHQSRASLVKRGVGFDRGAELSRVHRLPWILRAELAQVPKDIPYGREIRLPASIGVELVWYARERLKGLAYIQRPLREIARALVNGATKKSEALVLGQIGGFVVPIDDLDSNGRAAMGTLVADGWAREYRHAGGEDVVMPTVPELFMAELCDVVSRELEARIADPAAAARWLSDTCAGLFLGDVIGAQAIIDCGLRLGSFPQLLIVKLLEDRPEVRTMGAALIAMPLRDGSLMHLKIGEDGSITPSDRSGNAIGRTIPPTPGEGPGQTYGALTSWSILAHLTRRPMASGPELSDRVDLVLIMELGTCPFPLLHVSNELMGVMVHDLGDHGETLAREHALADPVTMSMRHLFAREWEQMDDFISAMLAEDSLVLMVRVHNALHALEDSSNIELSGWASGRLSSTVLPEIKRLMEMPAHSAGGAVEEE